MNDLTVSNIERQNVLNNRYAVDALQEKLGFTGMLFKGEYRFMRLIFQQSTVTFLNMKRN